MHRPRLRLPALLLALLVALAAAACSDDDSGDDGSSDGGGSGSEETTDASAPDEEAAGICGDETLRILVSNDDGVDGEGLEVLVEALVSTPGVEVTVSAPAENQSGTSDMTTDGEVATSEVEVAGVEATAVEGFPADAVLEGLAGEGDAQYDLVVSGINEGQNIGSIEQLSGTVGAARTAARNGVPALAVSQGALDDAVDPDFEAAAEIAVDWIGEQCDAIFADPEGDAEAGFLYNLNVPTCDEPGAQQGVVELDEGGVDVAGRDIAAVDCTVELADGADEVDTFLAGYAVVVPLPAS